MTYNRSTSSVLVILCDDFVLLGLFISMMREYIYLVILNADPSFLQLILLSSLADSNAILSMSGTLQVYFATVVRHQLKCLLGYHGLQ